MSPGAGLVTAAVVVEIDIISRAGVHCRAIGDKKVDKIDGYTLHTWLPRRFFW